MAAKIPQKNRDFFVLMLAKMISCAHLDRLNRRDSYLFLQYNALVIAASNN